VLKDITINNYIKYWDYGTPTGHQIKIAYGTLHKSKTLTINLNWPDRSRDKEGRVTTHWKKDFLEEAEKEKKELNESYQESVRQAKERKK
jgi:hypothetical protein